MVVGLCVDRDGGELNGSVGDVGGATRMYGWRWRGIGQTRRMRRSLRRCLDEVFGEACGV